MEIFLKRANVYIQSSWLKNFWEKVKRVKKALIRSNHADQSPSMEKFVGHYFISSNKYIKLDQRKRNLKNGNEYSQTHDIKGTYHPLYKDSL